MFCRACAWNRDFLTGMYEDAVWARILFLAAALIFSGFVLIFKKARLLYIPIFFALGVLLLSGVIDVYKSTAVSSEKAEITGTISTEIASKNEHSYYFIIDNVTIDGEERENRRLSCRAFCQTRVRAIR